MRHEHSPLESRQDLGSQLLKTRCIAHHLVVNTGERGDLRGNSSAGIDQSRPLADDAVAIHLDDPDLDDPVVGGTAAGGLKINASEFGVEGREHIRRQ